MLEHDPYLARWIDHGAHEISRLVVTLGRIAARAEPPPIDDADVRRMIDRARARRAVRQHARVRGSFGDRGGSDRRGLVARAAADRARRRDVLDVTLPTGDHLGRRCRCAVRGRAARSPRSAGSSCTAAR